jgi:hypothetical protein
MILYKSTKDGLAFTREIMDMSNPNKKHRREARRKTKRQAARRQQSISPMQRLAAAVGHLECWMSDDFGVKGQAQFFVYKEGAGLTGIACFLVDRGVVGLKDAWVRMGITRADLKDILDQCAAQDLRMRRAEPDQIRPLIAGGIRWAHENGMRLPKDWTRPASFIGGVGDWATADVSPFIKEFAGHPEDLRQRLIGEPFETYIRRTDVKFLFSLEAPFMDQKTGRYNNETDDFDPDDPDSDDSPELLFDPAQEEMLRTISEHVKPAAHELVAQTAAWLAARMQIPSPELLEAWKALVLSTALAQAATPDGEPDDFAEFEAEMMRDMIELFDPSRSDEIVRAIGQALDHLSDDPLSIRRAMAKCGISNPIP